MIQTHHCKGSGERGALVVEIPSEDVNRYAIGAATSAPQPVFRPIEWFSSFASAEFTRAVLRYSIGEAFVFVVIIKGGGNDGGDLMYSNIFPL